MSAERALAITAAFADELGQRVEPGIRLAVAGLVRVGVATRGSCEGQVRAGSVHPPYVELAAPAGGLTAAAVRASGLASELLLGEEAYGERVLFAREWLEEVERIIAEARAPTSPTWLPLGRTMAEDHPPAARERLAAAADLHNAFAAARLTVWQASFRRLGVVLLG